VSAIAAAGGLSDSAGVQVDVLHHNNGAMHLASQPDSTAGDTTQGVRLASYANTMEPSATPIGFAPPPLAGPDGTSQAANNQSRPPATPRTTRIDLSQINESAGMNYELGDRDVVMILPEEKHVIHVTGLVQKPDQFELTPNRDVRVLDAIAMAGGIKTPLADKVFVIRQLPNMPEPAMIHVSIAKAKRNGRENLRLAPGDLVSVEATVATSIFDAASNFFRVAIGLSGSIVTF
jgi:protein involved in polysaccharide export with SLBB domain